MDIGQEINQHLEWIETIVSLLGDQDIGDEDIQAVTRHDKCALGQWLDSEASVELGDLPELEKLIESHEAFHQLAGKLIASARRGDEAEAEKSQAQFIGMSREVISYLRIIQEKNRPQDNDSGPTGK